MFDQYWFQTWVFSFSTKNNFVVCCFWASTVNFYVSEYFNKFVGCSLSFLDLTNILKLNDFPIFLLKFFLIFFNISLKKIIKIFLIFFLILTFIKFTFLSAKTTNNGRFSFRFSWDDS